MTPLSSHNGFLGTLLPQIHFFLFLPQSSHQTYHSNGSTSAFQLPLLVMCVCAHACGCARACACVRACRPEVNIGYPPFIALHSVSFWLEIYFYSWAYVCLCVCPMRVQTSADAKDPSIKSSRPLSAAWCQCWQPNMVSLEGQWVFLTTQLSFQPLYFIYCDWVFHQDWILLIWLD